jgi:hypothetical protein
MTDGQWDVVAGLGQKASKPWRFWLAACPISVTGSNTHSDIVMGAFMIVLV